MSGKQLAKSHIYRFVMELMILKCKYDKSMTVVYCLSQNNFHFCGGMFCLVHWSRLTCSHANVILKFQIKCVMCENQIFGGNFWPLVIWYLCRFGTFPRNLDFIQNLMMKMFNLLMGTMKSDNSNDLNS